MGRVLYKGNRSYGFVRIGNHAGLADGNLIVIGNKTYEWDSGGGVGGGNVAVTIGANAAADITNLIAAINANKPSIPVSAYVDPLDTAVARIEADAEGANGNLAFTETMGDAANIISGTGLLEYGENAGHQHTVRGEHVVTTADVTIGNIMISTGLSTPRYFDISFRASTGAFKGVTALVTFAGTRIRVDQDGATSYAAGDIIRWEAWE